MLRRLKRRWWVLGLSAAAVALVIGFLVWAQALPWVANSYGFALAGRDGLPYRLHYAGRNYSTLGMCARADWCSSNPTACLSAAQLNAELAPAGLWPVREVARVSTLLGPSYPILAPATPAGMTTMTLYVPYQGCYQAYGLEGGP
ncbi:MAG: hypothetical protein ACHQ4H_07630 [Ktedonobacterales bacterium]